MRKCVSQAVCLKITEGSLMRHRPTTWRMVAAMSVAMTVVLSPGCSARPASPVEPVAAVASPDEPVGAAAIKLLVEVFRYGVAGNPEPMLLGYFPTGLPAAWVVTDDLNVAPDNLFASMMPALLSRDRYLVPILQDGKPVSEFEMTLRDGRWEVGRWPAESSPTGHFHTRSLAESQLRETLGPNTQTRVALLLPSGLIFLVGNNGSQEAAVYLGFVDEGPGLTGFHKYLPPVGKLYEPEELGRLLTPGVSGQE